MKKILLTILGVILLALLVTAVIDEVIQTHAGDINIAPDEGLNINKTQIQMKSPDGSWSCCGPNDSDEWGCNAGEC